MSMPPLLLMLGRRRLVPLLRRAAAARVFSSTRARSRRPCGSGPGLGSDTSRTRQVFFFPHDPPKGLVVFSIFVPTDQACHILHATGKGGSLSSTSPSERHFYILQQYSRQIMYVRYLTQQARRRFFSSTPSKILKNTFFFIDASTDHACGDTFAHSGSCVLARALYLAC